MSNEVILSNIFVLYFCGKINRYGNETGWFFYTVVLYIIIIFWTSIYVDIRETDEWLDMNDKIPTAMFFLMCWDLIKVYKVGFYYIYSYTAIM